MIHSIEAINPSYDKKGETVLSHVYILDFIMQLTISILSVFLLIIAIGAPPVVENVHKNKKDADSKADESDEVVCTMIFSFIDFTLFCLVKQP